MSHFSVLVIGPDLGGQLAPYSEDLEVPPYFNATEEWAIKTAVEEYGADAADPLSIAATLSTRWDDKYIVRDGVVGSMTTYNPASKWDYYRLGGRWAGSLHLLPGASGVLAKLAWEYQYEPDAAPPKDGTRADEALAGAVDWDACTPTYAVVAEGAWKSRADMGWFGVSRNEEMSEDEWASWWHDFMRKLPADMPVAVMDCHI